MSNAPDDGTVTVSVTGDVALVTLERPHKRNALSTHMEAELRRAIRSEAVARSRCVVITGAGGCFSAGADVTELREMTPAAIAAYYRGSGGVYEEIASMAQPVVAAIEGYCLGGGLELALAADLRIADPTAAFGFPEIGIGILPSSGGVTRAVRCLGAGRARDLILRGRRFDGACAERWGVIGELTAEGAHLETAMGIAAELAQFDPLALEYTKQVLAASEEAGTQASLLLERLAYAALNRTDP